MFLAMGANELLDPAVYEGYSLVWAEEVKVARLRYHIGCLEARPLVGKLMLWLDSAT